MNPTVARIVRDPQPSPFPGYLTTAEISARYNVQQEHVRLMIRRKKVPGVFIGSIWLVKEADWDEYERNRKPGGAPRGPRKKKKS